jgi:hypothetical protein
VGEGKFLKNISSVYSKGLHWIEFNEPLNWLCYQLKRVVIGVLLRGVVL